jgi:hypothetical protein
MSCLGWASGRGHLGVVKALVEKGARVNSTDKVVLSSLICVTKLIRKIFTQFFILTVTFKELICLIP